MIPVTNRGHLFLDAHDQAGRIGSVNSFLPRIMFSEIPKGFSPQDQLRNRMRELGLRPNENTYDEELFLEHAQALEQQWREASPEQRRKLGMDWYFDLIAPSVDRAETVHESESAIAPVSREVRDLKSLNVSSFHNRSVDENAQMFGRFEDAQVGVYGGSQIYDINPGGCVIARLKSMDVIGTSELSQCQALIARDGNRVAMSHVLYGEESLIPKLIEKMRQEMGGHPEWFYVHPESIVAPDADVSDQERAKEHNEYYERIAAENKLKPFTYYRVNAGYNPDNVGSSSVIVSQAGISVVGTRLAYKNPAWKSAASPKQWMRTIQTVKTIE